MSSLSLVGLMLMALPYMPWAIFSGAVERQVADGMVKLACYGALSQGMLLALGFSWPLSWATALAALYLAAPFHAGLFFGARNLQEKGALEERLAAALVHLILLSGQIGALLFVWS